MSERADRRWTEAEIATAIAKTNRAHVNTDQPTKPRKVGQKREYPVLPPERKVGVLSIVLPWPPSANHAYRNAYHGGKLLTDEHKAFRSQVEVIAWQLGRPWLEGPLELRLDLHPPVGRRGTSDLDNSCKHAIDALQHANFFADDNCIDVMIVRRHAQHGEGAVAVTLETIAKDESCRTKDLI
jgi:Holliday junction resolvase RusA-like endonuclease